MSAPEWIRGALPEALAAEVASVAAQLPPPLLEPQTFLEVLVRGERLRIPHRMYHPEVAPPVPERTAIALSCLYTRNHDGRVRQKHLARVVSVAEAWVVPFVLHLVGEYVVEIVQDIEAGLPRLCQPLYVEFLRQNPAFLPLIKQRAFSYWDCYYRGSFRRETYPGLRIVAALEEWLRGAILLP
jgi:hypothetical protein